jgi:hypothetical protein
MSFVQHHDVVEALAAERADETFHVGILPRRSRRRHDFADSHAVHSTRELDAVDPVAVAREISRGSVPGEGFHKLLSGPLGGGGVSDVHVDDASAVVRQNDEDEQDLEHHRRHDEEVDGDEASQVVVEKGPPRLRWRPPMTHKVLGYRRLRDLDPQFLQFPVNLRRAPEEVRLGHPSDERSDLRGDGRAASSIPAALPGPEEMEAGPLPSDHGSGLDDGDGIRPAVPEAG